MAVFMWMCLLIPTVAVRDETATSGSLEVNRDLDSDWKHAEKTDNGQVTLDTFKTLYVAKFLDMGLLSQTGVPNYIIYLKSVFETAFSLLMFADDDIPENYDDMASTLEEHGFKYAGALAGEYYFGGNSGADRLNLSDVVVLSDAWHDADKVQIKGKNRVTPESFEQVYLSRFEYQVQAVTRATVDSERVYLSKVEPAYKQFLAKTFDTSFKMMLAVPDLASKMYNGKGTLGEHCFRYAGLMAGEFYFPSGGGRRDLLHLVS